MELAWSKNDDSGDLPAREIARNCGQLLGRLDALLPCFYIAQFGASGRDLRERETEVAPGLFAVGERTGGSHPGVALHLGLILPVRLCRDEKARAALEEIPALIDSRQTTMSDRRRAVQARLDEAFGGDVVIADKESLDGFFALRPSPGLFGRLHESFDYVTRVLDNPAGVVRVTGTSPFPWRAHGEIMEWFHGLRGAGDRFSAWSVLTPCLVYGNAVALRSYCTERWARAGLHQPAEEPSKWFVVRPGLPDARIEVRLEMDEYGWAMLHLTLDEENATIHLSEVFDPFEVLVAWGREIDEGDLPIQMEIDEEGREAVLTVLRTDNPDRVLFRVTRKYTDEILLEGIVARAALAAALKAELRRFFTTEFDPLHWDLCGQDPDDADDTDDADDGYVQVKDRVLNHAWLAEKG